MSAFVLLVHGMKRERIPISRKPCPRIGYIVLKVKRRMTEEKKRMPRVRIELTTFRFLFGHIMDYETDALPTALPRLRGYWDV